MFKRILCLLLALVTALSFVIVALAADGEPAAEQTVVEEVLPEEENTASEIVEEELPEGEAPEDEVSEGEVSEDAMVEAGEDSELDEESETEAEFVPGFYVNGQLVCDAGMTLIENRNYVSVRAFFAVAAPGCSVVWVNDHAVVAGVTGTGEGLLVNVKPGQYYVVANERCLYVEGKVRNVNGSTMLPVRTLAQIFNGEVWLDELGNCHVQLGETLLTSGTEYYNEEQLDLLSRLINAEAGNQPILGKIAVGNVVLNRVQDPRFPDTIYGVIYAKNQFSVVKNGRINRKPNASSVTAAKLALEGAQVLDNALYFHVSGLNCWAARNRAYVTTIGNHDFYG